MSNIGIRFYDVLPSQSPYFTHCGVFPASNTMVLWIGGFCHFELFKRGANSRQQAVAY